MTSRTKQLNNPVAPPKQEYLRLKQRAHAYRAMVTKLFELPLRDSTDEVIADFCDIDLYSDDFLTDLEGGLRESSYSKKHAHQTA